MGHAQGFVTAAAGRATTASKFPQDVIPPRPQSSDSPGLSERSCTRGSEYPNVIVISASWAADKGSPGHTESEPVVSGAINVTPVCFH